MANPFVDAFALADAIIQKQKQNRAAPYTAELQRVGSQWAGADPQERERLNAQNNAIRAAYVASGGSPVDIDRSLWGSDTNQGFQTGAKVFTPRYFGDNLSRGQKMADADITGMYERKPTMARQFGEAELTGLLNGLPTMARTNADRNYGLAQDESQRGWAGVGLEQQGLGLKSQELDWERQKYGLDTAKDTQKVKATLTGEAYKYFDSLPTDNSIGTNKKIIYGVGLKTKAALKNQFQGFLNEYLNEADPYGTFQKEKNKFYDTYPDTGGYLVNALENALSQLSSLGK